MVDHDLRNRDCYRRNRHHVRPTARPVIGYSAAGKPSSRTDRLAKQHAPPRADQRRRPKTPGIRALVRCTCPKSQCAFRRLASYFHRKMGIKSKGLLLEPGNHGKEGRPQEDCSIRDKAGGRSVRRACGAERQKSASRARRAC